MSDAAPTLGDLPTPCLVLDRSKMERNLARMRGRAETLGVRLRPHCKTAKSAEVARRALASETGPITVSTMREAQYFADHGFSDITLAVGISPSRLAQAAQLRARGIDLAVTTDNPVIASEIVKAAEAHGVVFAVMIEVDVGEHRGGIDARSADLLEIAGILRAGGQEVRGILAHAGHTYSCSDPEAVADIAETERVGAVLAAERLRQAGHACPVVSVGSTPGALFARSLDGVTEMRPGVYMFMDLFQSGVGCCGLEDIAVTVMASVTNLRPESGMAHIDAGALALSKDRSTQGQSRDCGFGLLTDAFGRPLPGLTVEAVHQEHGRIAGVGADPAVLPIGSRVHVLPNHVCMTAAMYDRYAVVDGLADGMRQPVVAFWDRVNGW
ncbi:MAG: alanine racemase [Thalassobaculaceae bacterium]